MQADDDLKNEKRGDFSKGSNLSKLKRRMYSRERTGFLPWRRRYTHADAVVTAQDDWQYTEDPNQDEIKEVAEVKPQEKGSPVIKVLFIVAIIFFMVSIAGAMAYLFVGTSKIKSNTTVRVVIEGASSTDSGGVVELQVLVTNSGDTALELADLIMDYPEGTVSPVDFKTPLRGERIPLGKIEPNSARRGAIRAVVFGSRGSDKEIKIELQYRLKGSSALHSKISMHLVLISSDAMSVTVDGDVEITPGQSTPLTVTVKSYVNTPLNGVYLNVAIPFGFKIVDSSPPPLEDTGIVDVQGDDIRWILGAMGPGEERVVHLSVEADGQVGDKRYVQFSTGSGLSVDNTGEVIDDEALIVLAIKEHTLEINRPFLEVSLESGGQSLSNVVAHSGREVNIAVKWFNNLDVPINDAAITIALNGSALDKAQIYPSQGGFYRSVDSLLIWDTHTTQDKLKTISPGETGEFQFKIVPLSKSYLYKIRKPELVFDVHVTGKRLGESNVPEELVADTSYEIKVATDVVFNAYGLFRSSKFGAVGPMPPKVDKETQYGVVWEVSNTTSDLEDAVVRATLPHYVRWVGLTSPTNEQIIYNKTNRTLEWNLGEVKAGVGFTNKDPRSVSFAIGLTPSLSQLGGEPELLTNQTLSAVDSYTGSEIRQAAPQVDTQIMRDSGFSNAEASVVK